MIKNTRGVADVQLSRAVFQYIEYELLNYDTTRQVLDELREDVIGETTRPEVMVSGGRTPDPTVTKTVKLVQCAALARMERVVRAVDRSLGKLSDNHRHLFDAKYCRCMKWPQVCREMAISERSFFRIRRELVAMVAHELGLAEND